MPFSHDAVAGLRQIRPRPPRHLVSDPWTMQIVGSANTGSSSSGAYDSTAQGGQQCGIGHTSSVTSPSTSNAEPSRRPSQGQACSVTSPLHSHLREYLHRLCMCHCCRCRSAPKSKDVAIGSNGTEGSQEAELVASPSVMLVETTYVLDPQTAYHEVQSTPSPTETASSEILPEEFFPPRWNNRKYLNSSQKPPSPQLHLHLH